MNLHPAEFPENLFVEYEGKGTGEGNLICERFEFFHGQEESNIWILSYIPIKGEAYFGPFTTWTQVKNRVDEFMRDYSL